MNLKRDVINSCLRKEKDYSDKETADRAIIRLEQEKFRFGLIPYECEFCRKWHIGHPLLYRPVSEFSYWCQDVFAVIVPSMRGAQGEIRRAYHVAKRCVQMASARAFMNLKSSSKLDDSLLQDSCKAVGLMRKAALGRLNELYLEAVRANKKRPTAVNRSIGTPVGEETAEHNPEIHKAAVLNKRLGDK